MYGNEGYSFYYGFLGKGCFREYILVMWYLGLGMVSSVFFVGYGVYRLCLVLGYLVLGVWDIGKMVIVFLVCI